jgi:hypothetical protein
MMIRLFPMSAIYRSIVVRPLPVARIPVPSQTRVELFPEGGFIVRGIPSRVAFKASNQFGNPVLVKALLLNDKNKVLDTLKVQHDGMGMFTLASKEGENYKVNWTDASGKTGTTPVEITKTRGASMRVITTNEKAVVHLERTADAGDNFKQLNLLVHMNQKLYFTAAMKRADTLVRRPASRLTNCPQVFSSFHYLLQTGYLLPSGLFL